MEENAKKAHDAERDFKMSVWAKRTDVKIEKLRKKLKIHADLTYTPVVPGPEGEDDEPRIVDVTEGVSRSPSMRV